MSPGQGERWSLRPRKRKESVAEERETRGKRSKADESEKDDDEGKKTKGRRKSTDSNVSSAASEHSSVSRYSSSAAANPGAATPAVATPVAATPRTSGSPRSRRASASEDSRGGVSRRVLRNTVKTVAEEEPLPPTRPVGRRASKNK